MHRNIFAGNIPERTVFSVIAQRGKTPLRKLRAGYYHPFRPHMRKAQKHAFRFAAGKRRRGIAFFKQHCRFGDVRRNYVRRRGKLAHSAPQFRRAGAVRSSVVAHNRVDYFKRLWVCLKKFKTAVHLFPASQKAGINRLKFHSKALVMPQSGLNIVRKVADYRVAQTAGVA